MLVDEYQDTNPVQYQLLRLLVDEHRNICVVGDEDQSIYAFREADIRNILGFEKDFPGAAVVHLERNYRSSQPILDAATAVVSNNTERKGKKLYTERAEGEPVRFFQAPDDRAEASYVVSEMLRRREAGAKLGDVAIFYRTHAQSRPLEEELLKYNVPYAVVGGTRFYDRAEVKNALAYLRVIANPDDAESLLRIINTPVRGIGRTTIERLLELAETRGASLWSATRTACDEGLLRGAAAKRVPEFLALMDNLNSHRQGSVVQLLAHVLETSGYIRALEQEATVESEARLENLNELLAAVEEFESQNADAEPIEAEPPGDDGGVAADTGPRDLLDLFLEQVTLLSEADKLDADEDRVVLMTVHVAKGLEFPTVFVVGLEEGIFPHFASMDDPTAIEEERRLCYVAMTRAEEHLYLTNATMRRMYGSVRYNAPSRFLEEIPNGPRASERGLPGMDRVAASPLSPRGEERPHRRIPAAKRTVAADPGSNITVDYSESQSDPDEIPLLEVGRRVEHPVFGEGNITEVSGSGAAAKVKIQFDRAGIKTIKPKYAQLRVLS